MRDVLSPDSERRRALVNRFGAAMSLAAYREMVPPLVEDLGVFLRVGDATDVVTKEMYDFTDRDGTRIALRPEMTAGVVRAFVQHRPVVPWKVWYSGTNFRHERPQKGRYRMFDQLGVEVLGVDDPDLDVEVIALASDFFTSIGLRNIRLLVNSLGDHDERDAYTNALREHFQAHVDQLSDASRRTLERNPLRLLDSKRPEERALIDTAPRIGEHLGSSSTTHFARVLEGLDSLGIGYEVRPELVRGLDYYRRTTFEFIAESLDSAQNAIGGGGRYDGLSESMGGPPTDGIGFALGVDRMLLACDAEGAFDAPTVDPGVFVIDLVDGSHAREISHRLRRCGIPVDRRFGGGSLKAQMRAADRSGARIALLVGEDEVAADVVTLRPMLGIAADGTQRRVARSDLVEELHRILGLGSALDPTGAEDTRTSRTLEPGTAPETGNRK